MKTFNKTHLPETVTYNGLTYKFEQACANESSAQYDVMDAMCKNKKCVLVNVLSSNLKGKKDWNGQPYKPNTFLFTYQTK
jgi:hypothetical protein